MFAIPPIDGGALAAGIVAGPAIGCLGLDAFKKYTLWKGGTPGPEQQLQTLEDPGSPVSNPTYNTPAY